MPLIPTKTIKKGWFCLFFSSIFSKISILPALSNKLEILEIKLSLTNFSISFLSILEPINFSFKLELMESITSPATSDSKRETSSSKRILSISFSLSSFSPRLFATLENALRRLSNIIYPKFGCCGGCDCCMN